MSPSTQTKVVTITLNPAIDLTGTLNSLDLGEVNLAESGHLNAGGKGVNVASVLAQLGAEVTVTGFLGQENASPFYQLFSRYGIHNQFIVVPGATRTNIKLVESGSRVTDINFAGLRVAPKDIKRLEERLLNLARDHEYFVIAGSLPCGVSPSQVANWITLLTAQGKKVLFDSSGEALAAGINAAPWMVKPNEAELAIWAKQAGSEVCGDKSLAQQLHQTGIEHVVLSQGEAGVLWLCDQHTLRSRPPTVEVASTVGAGDTLVAAWCWASMQRMKSHQALRFATALSAHAVSCIDVGVPDTSRLAALEAMTSVLDQE